MHRCAASCLRTRQLPLRLCATVWEGIDTCCLPCFSRYGRFHLYGTIILLLLQAVLGGPRVSHITAFHNLRPVGHRPTGRVGPACGVEINDVMQHCLGHSGGYTGTVSHLTASAWLPPLASAPFGHCTAGTSPPAFTRPCAAIDCHPGRPAVLILLLVHPYTGLHIHGMLASCLQPVLSSSPAPRHIVKASTSWTSSISLQAYFTNTSGAWNTSWLFYTAYDCVHSVRTMGTVLFAVSFGQITSWGFKLMTSPPHSGAGPGTSLLGITRYRLFSRIISMTWIQNRWCCRTGANAVLPPRLLRLSTSRFLYRRRLSGDARTIPFLYPLALSYALGTCQVTSVRKRRQTLLRFSRRMRQTSKYRLMLISRRCRFI